MIILLHHCYIHDNKNLCHHVYDAIRDLKFINYNLANITYKIISSKIINRNLTAKNRNLTVINRKL